MRYSRLPFCVKAAPGIFQRPIESVRRGIPHCIAYFDDAEHLRNLADAVKRLNAGIRCNEGKWHLHG
jgi:hypothetical protein